MTFGDLASLSVLTTLGPSLAKHAVTATGRVRRWPPERIARAVGDAESVGVGLGLAIWLAIHSL
jgi:hypothetical protein